MMKLDADIASLVMGWEVFEKHRDFHAKKVEDDGYVWEYCIAYPKYCKNPFLPTINEKDAWQVIYRMRQLGWRYQLRDVGSKHEAIFRQKINGKLILGCHSTTTFQMAVCEAALKAIEKLEAEHVSKNN